jgi:type II secretory pathway pseudopilin PulG
MATDNKKTVIIVASVAGVAVLGIVGFAIYNSQKKKAEAAASAAQRAQQQQALLQQQQLLAQQQANLAQQTGGGQRTDLAPVLVQAGVDIFKTIYANRRTSSSTPDYEAMRSDPYINEFIMSTDPEWYG